ncbi:MICOS complex subunit MIC27-like isoform X2 [Heptranchias perlo]|uniref:MICOS complex subunit MIC27-like isoform X2 n=1 Tax=Heptranchias perlo TaxID=212740 RepID=UPI0035598B9B
MVVKLSALPAGLGLVSFRVYASSKSQQDKDLIKPEQLSVYNEPYTNFKYVTEQPGRLLEGISVVRQTVQPYAAQCKGAYDAIKTGAENTIAFGKGAYVFLKDPPEGFFPRVGVITVSGLAGLILASRGSRFKKMVYPLGLTTVGMAVCYPHQAIAVATFSGRKIYAVGQCSLEAVGSLWKGNREKKQGTKKKEGLETTKTQEEQPKVESTATPLAEDSPQKLPKSEVAFVPAEAEKQIIVLDPSLMDHGQSNPEDTDLYSTRS